MPHHRFPTIDTPTTRHAAQRIAQRGICPSALQIVWRYGSDRPAGGDRICRELHYKRMHEAIADGVPVAIAEAALRIEVILTAKEVLITCYQRAPRHLSRPSRNQRLHVRRGRRQ